jgi:hypothetical protein
MRPQSYRTTDMTVSVSVRESDGPPITRKPNGDTMILSLTLSSRECRFRFRDSRSGYQRPRGARHFSIFRYVVLSSNPMSCSTRLVDSGSLAKRFGTVDLLGDSRVEKPSNIRWNLQSEKWKAHIEHKSRNRTRSFRNPTFISTF